MLNIGPIMLDIAATRLSNDDERLLANPLVGGIILFRRNFESAEQVLELTNSIRAINPRLIIAVDQEGGRVQRFKQSFSRLPRLSAFGKLYKSAPQQAINFASDLGELMALEVQSVGCDISFAPVLDLGNPASKVIGDRAFSTLPEEIICLASSYIKGLAKAGMAATGKHFPGHGSVIEDSHIAIPIDNRKLEDIKNSDLKTFINLTSELKAIMPAHIIYPQVDSHAAGFSKIWLQQILRQQLAFDGVIFSDDLTMKGAEAAGDFRQRANAALKAGCDMVLVCNNRAAVSEVINELQATEVSQQSNRRLQSLLKTSESLGLASLKLTERWQVLNQQLKGFQQLTNC